MIVRNHDSENYGYVLQERQLETAFLDNLRRLDPALRVFWEVRKQRYVVFRDGKYVMTVQTVDGQFCQPDNRLIQKLFLCDTHRYASKVHFIRSLHLEDEKITTKKRKEQDEYVRACHRDMLPFTRGVKSVNLPGKEWKRGNEAESR